MEKYLYLKKFTIKLPWIGKRKPCEFKNVYMTKKQNHNALLLEPQIVVTVKNMERIDTF